MTLEHSERHLELLEGPYRQYCQKPTSHPRQLNDHLLLKGKRTASLIVLPEPFVGHQLMQGFRNNWSTGCQNSYSRGGKRSCRARSQGYPSTSKHILLRAGPWPGLRDGSGTFLSFMMSQDHLKTWCWEAVASWGVLDGHGSCLLIDAQYTGILVAKETWTGPEGIVFSVWRYTNQDLGWTPLITGFQKTSNPRKWRRWFWESTIGFCSYFLLVVLVFIS